MEAKIKLTCKEANSDKINELSAELWTLSLKIEAELSREEQLSTYTPIAELLKQASWLLDIDSNLAFFNK